MGKFWPRPLAHVSVDFLGFAPTAIVFFGLGLASWSGMVAIVREFDVTRVKVNRSDAESVLSTCSEESEDEDEYSCETVTSVERLALVRGKVDTRHAVS